MLPLWNMERLIKWKTQCWNSEAWPNSDNSQTHRCSTRTKINFTNYLEVDGSGWRELGGAKWLSGEIHQCQPEYRRDLGGTRNAHWWLISSVHFRLLSMTVVYNGFRWMVSQQQRVRFENLWKCPSYPRIVNSIKVFSKPWTRGLEQWCLC